MKVLINKTILIVFAPNFHLAKWYRNPRSTNRHGKMKYHCIPFSIFVQLFLIDIFNWFREKIMWIKSNTNKFHKLLYRYIVGTAGCQCHSIVIIEIRFRLARFFSRLLGLKHTRLYRLLLKVWIVRMDLKSYLRSALFNKIHLHETEAFPKIFNYNIFRSFFF